MGVLTDRAVSKPIIAMDDIKIHYCAGQRTQALHIFVSTEKDTFLTSKELEGRFI